MHGGLPHLSLEHIPSGPHEKSPIPVRLASSGEMLYVCQYPTITAVSKGPAGTCLASSVVGS